MRWVPSRALLRVFCACRRAGLAVGSEPRARERRLLAVNHYMKEFAVPFISSFKEIDDFFSIILCEAIESGRLRW